ncbi:hypothetical protein [Streptomyces viridochromogenes]|uniref:Lipoprotein n=1 Tax=Streptomyces viridochromogenes Tue57 TaxID=1160705 RepID=L8PHM3_STRVR|nr:hypothetical protein [Streptomyces viridochromogenes]ELS55930.1 hypothetical protein STVIR_3275 [Streptomyces viridochromogenes Tue57]
MRSDTGRHLAAAAALVVSAALTGCSADAAEATPSEPSRQAAAPAASAVGEPTPAPETSAEFLALAKKAMDAQKGWRFTVRGSENLVLQGRESGATYSARVHRTTGAPWALHSVGSSRSSKGVTESEEVYVVDGVGYVKEGAAAWRHGPLTDPGIAGKVEDPVAALDTFEEYGRAVSLTTSDRRVELRVRTVSAALPAVRGQGVVRKTLRELAPTLEQLRAAGVAAPESGITVERAEETLVLDSATYEVTSHTFRCVLRIPYGTGGIRYAQEVTERTAGPYEGAVVLPAGVR